MSNEQCKKSFYTFGEDRMKSTSERLFKFDLVSGPALEAKKPQVSFLKSIDTGNLEVPS